MAPTNINYSLDKATSNIFSMKEKGNVGQIVLCIVFILYLIMDYKTPEPFAGWIDSMVGKIVVVILAVVLFACANPILGVIGFFVAYELIRRSSVATGTDALSKYLPTEKKKQTNLTMYNQFPYTLEQEVVHKMAPLCMSNPLRDPSFKSDESQTFQAAPVDYKGVV
jgi:hypothetical protein